LHDALGPDRRPQDLPALDAYLSPLIEVFVRFAAPIEMDPMITAVK
jgi:hypothetical protein